MEEDRMKKLSEKYGVDMLAIATWTPVLKEDITRVFTGSTVHTAVLINILNQITAHYGITWADLYEACVEESERTSIARIDDITAYGVSMDAMVFMYTDRAFSTIVHHGAVRPTMMFVFLQMTCKIPSSWKMTISFGDTAFEADTNPALNTASFFQQYQTQ